MRSSPGQPTIFAITNGYVSVSAGLGAGGDVEIPAGYLLMGMIGTGASFVATTKVEISIDGGTTWKVVEALDGTDYQGKTQTQWTMFQAPIWCGVSNVRIKNSGGGALTAFQYLYAKEEAQ